jgi:hypothetical protein
MFVDRDEAEALSMTCRETLTPGLVQCVEGDLIFRPQPEEEDILAF